MRNRIADLLFKAASNLGWSYCHKLADSIITFINAEPVEGWIFTTCEHYRGCENEALSCQKYIDGDTSCMRPATQAEVNSGEAVWNG